MREFPSACACARNSAPLDVACARNTTIVFAKMLVGSILQVKPILQLKGGRTEPVESQRTKKRAMARLKELIYADCPRNDGARLTIMHGDVLEEARELAQEFKSQLGLNEVEIYDLPPAILVHAGPGVIAVSFFTEG